MNLSSKYDKQTAVFCARMKGGPNIMLKYRTNRKRRFGKPLNGLLNEAEKSIMTYLLTDVDDVDDDDDDKE